VASNKNQHFVPRCYLKAFTQDGGGAAINLFNLDRRRSISSAPVKSQCSGDYFYGEDLEIERALQGIEGAYANLLTKLLSPGYQLTDEDRHLLTFFWAIQYLRTEAASRRSIEFSIELEELAADSEQVPRLGIREAVRLSMEAFPEAAKNVADLKVRLVRNRTELPFVVCDDPAVIASRWHAVDPRAKGMTYGVGSSGVLLLLPLSPDVLFLAFDPSVYSIPSVNGWVDTRREDDIRALNDHQFLNARANLYFRDWDSRTYLETESEVLSECRPDARHRVTYAVPADAPEGWERYKVVNYKPGPEDGKALMHIQSVQPVPRQWPSFLGWRADGSVYSNGTGVGFLRREVTLLHKEKFKKLPSR
jgi:hypothetical protein